MRSNALRAAVAGAGMVAALATGPLASAATDNALTGSPRVPLATLAAAGTADCEAGGPTAGDNAIANQLRPNLNGPRLGASVDGYRVSCARVHPRRAASTPCYTKCPGGRSPPAPVVSCAFRGVCGSSPRDC